MNRYSMSVCGIHTIQEVQRINFDQVFMGVTSYSDQTGFTCGVDEEAVLKKNSDGSGGAENYSDGFLQSGSEKYIFYLRAHGCRQYHIGWRPSRRI